MSPSAAKALEAAANRNESAPAGRLARFGLTCVGQVKPLASRAIEASPLSVGFETLDREHFDPKKAYPHLAKLGVKWARCQTGWCRCEPERGKFDFRWLDDVVDGLLGIGIQPWFNLGYGNKLYTPQADEAAVGWAPVFDDETRKAWLRYTTRIVEHFRDRVQHWEIWNEPNIKTFWKPRTPDPDDYVDLVKITAAEIHKQAPSAVIIGGALAGMPMEYAEGCLSAGLADHIDKLSYHPYRSVPERGLDKQIRTLRELVAKTGKPIKLWQGENGCPSKGGPDSVGALSKLAWTEEAQAKWLLRRILTDLRMEIELTSYFHTVDLVGYRGKTNFKGLLRGGDYTPKPAYTAFQCLCALFDARTEHRPGLEVELTDQKKERLQEGWSVRQGRPLVTYWFPAILQKPWKPRKVSMKLPLPNEAKIDRPVLIDPLTSRVYRPSAAESGKDVLKLNGLPLLDYPLIISDADVV